MSAFWTMFLPIHKLLRREPGEERRKGEWEKKRKGKLGKGNSTHTQIPHYYYY
jgi:hypothetical protein